MPMELSMPCATSLTRGIALPLRSFGETLLVTSAPRRPRSKTLPNSYEKQPDAGMTGFLSVSAPTLTDRSTTLVSACGASAMHPRAVHLLHVEHRAFAANALVDGLAVHLNGSHA